MQIYLEIVVLISWEEVGSRWDTDLGKQFENEQNEVELYSRWDTCFISFSLKNKLVLFFFPFTTGFPLNLSQGVLLSCIKLQTHLLTRTRQVKHLSVKGQTRHWSDPVRESSKQEKKRVAHMSELIFMTNWVMTFGNGEPDFPVFQRI